MKNHRFPLNELPRTLKLLRQVGLVVSAPIKGHVLYECERAGHIENRQPAVHNVGIWDMGATITPAGDYLVMFPEGGHYCCSEGKKVNRMTALRSKDKGRTWSEPFRPYEIDYNEHGFIPLIPAGTKRLYSFGTQPVWSDYDFTNRSRIEDAPIGFRWSDDDGRTWSLVQLIRPRNDPIFQAMSRTSMCETAAGVWLLGADEADWSQKPLVNRHYILRSEDRGATWDVLPGPRPQGWQCPGFGRMGETRLIHIAREEVLALSRTPEGHLWQHRSFDGGRTWTPLEATSLVHPDAPAMVYYLSDRKTLLALHHNRASAARLPLAERAHLSADHPCMADRAQIWLSVSRDAGHTWEPPRFAFCNALAPVEVSPFLNHQCSYTDVLVDAGVVHFCVPHRWRRALHLQLPEADLGRLPTAADLGV